MERSESLYTFRNVYFIIELYKNRKAKRGETK